MATATKNKEYKAFFVAGDTEYIRLNVRDSNGDIIDVSDGTCVVGMKRDIMDTAFIIPEKVATMYEYDQYEQPFSIEFKFTSDETAALLNYNGKERKKLRCFYDIELTTSHIGVDDKVTLLQGLLEVNRSISGRVV